MKKLYRSQKESKLAGICGGLGGYFEIDPVIFRILFLFSIIFLGLGLLAYLIMWIMIPVEETGSNGHPIPRRLYLSNIERKIAGVCSGMGEFFAIDPVFFRVIFLILVFAGGLGILLYLIFWLIIPRKK